MYVLLYKYSKYIEKQPSPPNFCTALSMASLICFSSRTSTTQGNAFPPAASTVDLDFKKVWLVWQQQTLDIFMASSPGPVHVNKNAYFLQQLCR